MPQKLKTLLSNILLVIISIIITLALAEVVLRFTPYKDLKRPKDYHKIISKGYYKNDPELIHDITKNFTDGVHDTYEFKYPIFSNKYGCFDHERKVPNDYILTIGDSFAWGFTPLDKKWTTYLEEKTGKFILKCGVSAYGTRQELIKAKRVIKQIGKTPKYLFLMYYENDMQDDFSFSHQGMVDKINMSTGEVEYNPKPQKTEKVQKEESENKIDENLAKSDINEPVAKQSFLRELRYKSVIYNLYVVKIKRLIREFKKSLGRKIRYGNKMPPSSEEFGSFRLVEYLHQRNDENVKWYGKLVDYHRESLENFINYSKDINTTLIILDINGTLENDAFKDIIADNELYYLNLKKAYPKQSKWTYDLHWDVKGNQEVGEAIYKFLEEKNLLKK